MSVNRKGQVVMRWELTVFHIADFGYSWQARGPGLAHMAGLAAEKSQRACLARCRSILVDGAQVRHIVKLVSCPKPARGTRKEGESSERGSSGRPG